MWRKDVERGGRTDRVEENINIRSVSKQQRTNEGVQACKVPKNMFSSFSSINNEEGYGERKNSQTTATF